MQELHLPESEAPFVDDRENREYLSGGTYSVPMDDVDRYVEDGWDAPDDVDETALESVPDYSESIEGFTEDKWFEVKAAIENGDFDGDIEEALDAEEDRQSGPRPSIVKSLESRTED